MNANMTCTAPEGRCADQAFRLAVYEAGHALTARALGLDIVEVRMLPRPPILLSDKKFVGHNWASLTGTLRTRIIELFGGQQAEELACSSHTCCNGDVARIDELTRLVAGIEGIADAEDVYFELEDAAEEIFARPEYRDAILPVAEFLFSEVAEGREVVDGSAVEALLDKLVPARTPESWVKRLFSGE